MDDQHNTRCLGCYGNPDVKTPAIDSLAENGIAFIHAYAQNPICMPSRISFMTGQYPHTHGVYGNWGSIPKKTLSLAKHLTDHEYQTAAVGKLHISHDWPGNDFQTRLRNDSWDCAYYEEEEKQNQVPGQIGKYKYEALLTAKNI